MISNRSIFCKTFKQERDATGTYPPITCYFRKQKRQEQWKKEYKVNRKHGRHVRKKRLSSVYSEIGNEENTFY